MINDITATVGAGYSYSRGKPNRSECHFRRHHTVRNTRSPRQLGPAKGTFGLLRGTSTVELTRTMYGDATLATGGSVTADDRDTLGVEFTARIGYAISPALLPFMEASVGRENTTRRLIQPAPSVRRTPMAFAPGPRSIWAKSSRAKFAVGYLRRSLDDPSLSDISGLTLDGDLTWSPQRGTDINLGLATTVEAATTAGEAGAVVYEFDSSLTHELNSALVARLGATYEYRDYDSGSNRSNQLGYGASAGLTWSINRYLDLDADASYEKIEEPGRTDEETMRVGVGLRLRR
jgi:hypothetical protein